MWKTVWSGPREVVLKLLIMRNVCSDVTAVYYVKLFLHSVVSSFAVF